MERNRSDTSADGPTGPSVRSRTEIPRWLILVAAIVAEIVLTLAMREFSILGLVHLVAIVAVGMYGVLKRELGLVICAIAYVTGAEVLWRQLKAPVFYLAAPYVVILLSSFAVLLVLRRLGKDARLAVLYAALLLPATVATVRTAGEGARELISFALSGPLALAAFVAFTSQVQIAPWLYRRVLWVTLISSVGPLTVAVTTLRADLAASAAGSIEFKGQSNFSASGGFGPVQVSSALSLGIMAAIFLLISERERVAKIIAAVLAAVLAVQTLLTFSRGGSFAVGIAVAALLVVQARDRRIRNRIIAIATVALALAYFLVFPWLEDFTGGEFDKRFSDTESSRTELAANDAEIFTRNIMLGVGPGMTKYQRLTYEICQIRSDKCDDEGSSHTEFTRMLGEHGIPGLAAMVLLAMLAWSGFRRAGPGREFAVAWIAWTIAQMFYANLRIVAVPFAFGLAFLRFTGNGGDSGDDDDDDDDAAAETGAAAPSAPRPPTPAEVRAMWRSDHSLQRMTPGGVTLHLAAPQAATSGYEPLTGEAPAPLAPPEPDLSHLPPPPPSTQGLPFPPIAPDAIIPPIDISPDGTGQEPNAPG